jgi:hypothetical protein
MKHIKSMLSDERGAISHKRIISMIGTFVLCYALLQRINALPELISAIEFIVIAAIGSTAVDKFSYKNPIIDQNPVNDQNTNNDGGTI